MSELDRARLQLDEMGYLSTITPTMSGSAQGSVGRLNDMLATIGLVAMSLDRIANHRVKKEDVTNDKIVWFDAVPVGKRMCLKWRYHPSRRSEMMMFKLIFE